MTKRTRLLIAGSRKGARKAVRRLRFELLETRTVLSVLGFAGPMFPADVALAGARPRVFGADSPLTFGSPVRDLSAAMPSGWGMAPEFIGPLVWDSPALSSVREATALSPMRDAMAPFVLSSGIGQGISQGGFQVSDVHAMSAVGETQVFVSPIIVAVISRPSLGRDGSPAVAAESDTTSPTPGSSDAGNTTAPGSRWAAVSADVSPPDPGSDPSARRDPLANGASTAFDVVASLRISTVFIQPDFSPDATFFTVARSGWPATSDPRARPAGLPRDVTPSAPETVNSQGTPGSQGTPTSQGTSISQGAPGNLPAAVPQGGAGTSVAGDSRGIKDGNASGVDLTLVGQAPVTASANVDSANTKATEGGFVEIVGSSGSSQRSGYVAYSPPEGIGRDTQAPPAAETAPSVPDAREGSIEADRSAGDNEDQQSSGRGEEGGPVGDPARDADLALASTEGGMVDWVAAASAEPQISPPASTVHLFGNKSSVRTHSVQLDNGLDQFQAFDLLTAPPANPEGTDRVAVDTGEVALPATAAATNWIVASPVAKASAAAHGASEGRPLHLGVAIPALIASSLLTRRGQTLARWFGRVVARLWALRTRRTRAQLALCFARREAGRGTPRRQR